MLTIFVGKNKTTNILLVVEIYVKYVDKKIILSSNALSTWYCHPAQSPFSSVIYSTLFFNITFHTLIHFWLGM